MQATRFQAKGMRALLRRAQTIVPHKPGVHLLAYHLIEAGTGGTVDISLDMFRSHITALRDHHMLCSFREAITTLGQEKGFKQHKAVVTFDDAYENFYTTAWPVIRELNIPVMLYVPVDFIEEKGRPPIQHTVSLKACSWPQIQEMVAGKLVEIGSHSCSHRNLTELNEREAEQELGESRKRLEEKLNLPVTSFCYPRGLWSRRLEKIVKRHYDTAVIGGGMKTDSDHWNPYRLSRLPVRTDMPSSIVDILSHSVWLEERFAAWARPWRQFLFRNAGY